MTSVFVTHDQEEALEVADRVVVMNHGRIEQIGTPDEVYDHPATPFVFEFLGHVNRLPPSAGMAGQGYARPHEFAVLAQPAADAWPARLVHSATVGPVSRLEFALEADRQTINVELPRAAFRALQIVPGTVAYLQPTRVRHFDDAATRLIATRPGRGIASSRYDTGAVCGTPRHIADVATVSPSPGSRTAGVVARASRAPGPGIRAKHVGRLSPAGTRR